MDAHYGHSGSKEVQISGFQLISQEYLDFTQDSNQKKAKSEKVYTPVQPTTQLFYTSVKRSYQSLDKFYTPVKPTMFELTSVH